MRLAAKDSKILLRLAYIDNLFRRVCNFVTLIYRGILIMFGVSVLFTTVVRGKG